jgi:hypothetical protein
LAAISTAIALEVSSVCRSALARAWFQLYLLLRSCLLFGKGRTLFVRQPSGTQLIEQGIDRISLAGCNLFRF